MWLCNSRRSVHLLCSYDVIIIMRYTYKKKIIMRYALFNVIGIFFLIIIFSEIMGLHVIDVSVLHESWQPFAFVDAEIQVFGFVITD